MKVSEANIYRTTNINRNINAGTGNKKQNNCNKTEKQSFRGGVSDAAFNLLDKGFKVLDKNAMIQVSFVDTAFTNIPRTVFDLKTGLAAAFETFRREFSGLFINCLMPGLIVKGMAGILPKSEELKGTNVIGSWANGDSINKLQGVYKEAQESGAADTTKEYVERALGSLEGLDGKKWVKYSSKAQTPEYISAVDDITKAVSLKGSERKKILAQAQTKLASVTKAENVLKFNNTPQAELGETLRDIADMGSKFNNVKDRTLSDLGKTASDMSNPEISAKINESVNKYSSKLSSFVNKKSLIGLGIVLTIAASMQKINRSITKKQFHADGAPIYKDFGKKDTTPKMNEEEKKKFKTKKAVSAAGMYGLAALSMMKKPSLGMLQFSNIFPTLDQCRWIAATSFAFRMLGADDENELRETTVRDVASFSGLYFLGDYVKKGAASAFEKLSTTKQGSKILGENVVLLNRKKEIAKPVIKEGASILEKTGAQVLYRAEQFGNWIKNTDLKTASEVSSTKVRNLRNLCRVADIAFSFAVLGLLLPKYNRKVTEKKVAEAKEKEMQEKNSLLNFSHMQKNEVPEIFKNLI